MTYNVLNYGDNCQGPPSGMHLLLRKIISGTHPDLLGLVKLQAIKRDSSDNAGVSPVGFGDSILRYALNPGGSGNYKYCPFTNVSGDKAMSVLFYNKTKLGFLGVNTVCSLVSDFDLYKLYYLDSHLSLQPDTTFLYVLLNHTKSGASSTTRDQQVAASLQGLRDRFSHLPNLIDMGDFNLHNSSEPGYLQMVTASDSGFRFSDPPFFPEGSLTYPNDWDTNPTLCASYLSTSTRLSTTDPNSCGTGGGGKSWFDHILLSPWIISGANYIHYIRGSYKTIGNDGMRASVSINDSITVPPNKSAPDSIIESLYGFSNKYPVMLSLELLPNTTGISPQDPDQVAGIENQDLLQGDIRVLNPVREKLCLYGLNPNRREELLLTWYDIRGRELTTAKASPERGMCYSPVLFSPGIYILHVVQGNNGRFFRVIHL